MIDDYNEEGDFAISLNFNGLKFPGDKFRKIVQPDRYPGYFIPVNYSGREVYLFITSVGDIFEYEVVNCKSCVERLFSNEIFVPKLLGTYDSQSMNVVLRNDCVIVTFKRIHPN